VTRPPERQLAGIHHVTAIASDPQPNLDFYIRFLGLRLVKRTVNFDDPETYHFYFGDETGSPGSILTFFPWPGARKGRKGAGQVTATTFYAPVDCLSYWSERAQRYGFTARNMPERFGEPVLHIDDPDGLSIEIVASGPAPTDVADGNEIPAECGVLGIHSATMTLLGTQKTADFLATLGFRQTGREGHRTRYTSGASSLDLLVDDRAARAQGGAGTVHHIAFRTPDRSQQEHWQRDLLAAGYEVSPLMDRKYFQSIYFREPSGVLFEIATDGPGFLVDETADSLGSALMLPDVYESRRAKIEALLPPITIPASGLLTGSY
jgi:glyoxalase family protein